MKIIKYIIISLLLLSGYGCIDEVNFNKDIESTLLVIEGFIDTEAGPHRVLLSRSAKYGSVFDGFSRPELDGFVRVRDSEGRLTILTDRGQGVYETPENFKAEVGKSYSLLITTRRGENFISKPETVTPTGTINSIEARYIEKAGGATGVEVFATYTDNPDEDNFYRLANSGIYKIETRPDLFTTTTQFGTITPAPKECCATCWINEVSADGSLRLDKDDFSSNGQTRTQLAAFIRDNGVRYTDKYMARISLLSLSREAFQFFRILNEQQSINGDIFDPPPATTRGNFVNIDEPDNNVIGYFFASDVSKDSVFIDRSILGAPQLPRIIEDDCRTLIGAQLNEPSFW